MPVTQMHAGLICTLLLIGTMAGMFGCMSAARCRRYFAFALCLVLTALDAALLVAPLSSPRITCPARCVLPGKTDSPA